MYDDAAKERQKTAGKEHGRGKEKLPDNCPEAISIGDARDQVGGTFGVSGQMIDHHRHRLATADGGLAIGLKVTPG